MLNATNTLGKINMVTIAKPSLVPFAHEHISKMTEKYAKFKNAYAPSIDSNDYENLSDICEMWMLANGIDSKKATEWLAKLAFLSLVIVGMIDAFRPIKESDTRFGINFDSIPVIGFSLDHIPGGIIFIRKCWKSSSDFCGLKKLCNDVDFTINTDGKLFVALLPKYMLCKIFETESFEEAYKLYATCAIASIDDKPADEWPIVDTASVIEEIQ